MESIFSNFTDLTDLISTRETKSAMKLKLHRRRHIVNVGLQLFDMLDHGSWFDVFGFEIDVRLDV